MYPRIVPIPYTMAGMQADHTGATFYAYHPDTGESVAGSARDVYYVLRRNSRNGISPPMCEFIMGPITKAIEV